MPRVSVVIPSYNMAQFLPTAVESVLQQTYQDFEVIVIDDGSTDNTPELANTFPPSVTYFRQENQGSASARNNGISMAKGEYIAFLDSDDVMFEDALEKRVVFLDEHPEAGFCYGQFYTIDEDGRSLRLRKARGPKATGILDGKEEIAHILFPHTKHMIHTSAILVRRSCFDETGLFDTGLRIHQDVDMWIRLAKKFAVGHLAEPIVHTRYHPQSITARSSVKIIEAPHRAVLDKVFTDAEIGPMFGHLKKRAYLNLYCLFARVSARTGNRGLWLRYMFKAVKTYPGVLWDMRGLYLLLGSTKEFLPQKLRRLIVEVLIALRLR